MAKIIEKKNVVVGNSIKALIYAYKKNLPFIVSTESLQQPFYKYLDFSYYYHQFGIEDKEPLIFNTNHGKKVFGPPEKYIWDFIIFYMIMGGHCYGYGRDRQIKIEGNKISITYPGTEDEVIIANKIYVFEVGDILTDFSILETSEYEIYDYFQNIDGSNVNLEYDIRFIDLFPLKEIWNLEKGIATVCKGIEEDKILSPEITPHMLLLAIKSIDLKIKDIEHSHREVRYVPKQRIQKRKNKHVRFPTIGLERLLSMKHVPQNHISRMYFLFNWRKKKGLSRKRSEYFDE